MAALTKHHKIKREKIRFGQAPRNALPTAPSTAGLASDDGLGADHEGVAKAGETTPGIAAGTSTLEASSSNTNDANPLAPPPGPQKKTRYSARAKAVAVEKVQKKNAKVTEKAIAAAPPMTDEEKAAAATQASPLGLSGDTVKKKKKVKVKGAAKERLQNEAPKPPAPKPEETPSKAPDRGTPYEGTAGPPKTPASSDTPAAPAPAPPPQ